jgi:AcrR family transcriptional regulator
MPKVVDHQRRRQELGRAVWRVIRRDGVDGASVRRVAHEAGWSPGALRHYFASQSELLAFAMQLLVERVEERVAALQDVSDPREGVAQRLHELLPLDEERRAENTIWLAFAARALIDRGLRTQYEQVHEALRAACTRAVQVVAPSPGDGLDAALAAERLHALLDGLAVHTALHPEVMSPERIVALVDGHLDALERETGRDLRARPAARPSQHRHRTA